METPKKVVLIGDKDHNLIVAPSTPDTVASTPSPQRNRNLYHHSSPISPQTNARRQLLGGVGGEGKGHSSPILALPHHLHLSHIQKRLGNKSSRCQQCRSRVRRFIAIYVIVVVSLYNNFTISNRNYSNESQSSFSPSWKEDIKSTVVVGNDHAMPQTQRCIFAPEEEDSDSGITNRIKMCSNLRYKPYPNYNSPDPTTVLQSYLPNQTTIYLFGDSVTWQYTVHLLCTLSAISEMVQKDIQHVVWPRGSLDFVNATFRLYNTNYQTINIIFREQYHGQSELLSCLGWAKSGDIIVMNQGLHYMPSYGRGKLNQSDLLKEYQTTIESKLILAMQAGIRLVWRETTAAHFNTTDGYISPEIITQQQTKNVTCVSSSASSSLLGSGSSIINGTVSRYNSNDGYMIPYMRDQLNIPILEIWESSLALPAYCYAGLGTDCVHFVSKTGGGTSYFTDALLDYIALNYTTS